MSEKTKEDVITEALIGLANSRDLKNLPEREQAKWLIKRLRGLGMAVVHVSALLAELGEGDD